MIQRKRVVTFRVVLLLAMMLPFAAAQDSPKRAMTFLDVLEQRAVGAAQVSPDGRRVIYTVSIPQ